MTDIFEVTAVWSGFSGSPGYSKFRFQNLTDQAGIDAAGAAVRTFFSSIAAYISTGHSVQVQQILNIYDMATGKLVAEATQTTQPLVVNGTSSTAAWAGGVGAYIQWKTPVIFNGHRVRGRTFLVPLRGVAEVDGTLLSAVISTIKAAGDALISNNAADFIVWGKQHVQQGTPPKPVQVGGAAAPVTECAVPDKTGILRSRRD